MMMDYRGINIDDDYFSFQNQIIKEYGEKNSEQAGLFFERAVKHKKEGLFQSAKADAKFAITLTQISNRKGGLHVLIDFLCRLLFEDGQFEESKLYYELGVKLLPIQEDSEDDNYYDDKEIYEKLKAMLEGI